MVIFFAIYAFILGAIFASFFGVICARVPKGESIIKPNSHCDTCGYELKWYDNIPIISYLIYGGKCRKCKAKIGISSFVFELLGGITFCLSFLTNKFSFESIFFILIASILFLIAMYDYYTHTILDVFWIILAIFCVGLYLYQVFVNHCPFYLGLIASLIAFVFFMGIKLIGKFILGNDCLGGGDVIIMSIVGLILGPIKLLIAVLIASVFGSIIEIILIVSHKKDKNTEIAFCPYLVLGIIFAMNYGNFIIDLFNKVVI